MNKTVISQLPITRQQIGNWVHTILPDVSPAFKIEQLGKGVIYCRIFNHYFPGIILVNRIIWTPKNDYENMLNLKLVQNALIQCKSNIPIDPIRLSKQKFNENWAFICALYKYLSQTEESVTTLANQEKMAFNYYPQVLAQAPPLTFAPKRTIQQLYPQTFYQNLGRPLFFPIEQNIHQTSYNNPSKYSVGKLQGMSVQMANSSPNKGKWSVNSHMFQNNLTPIIDRVKQILLKSFNNTEKIRQIKILLNIPLNQEVIVKVEEDQNPQIIVTNTQTSAAKLKNQAQHEKQESKQVSQTAIQTREEIKLSQCNQ